MQVDQKSILALLGAQQVELMQLRDQIAQLHDLVNRQQQEIEEKTKRIGDLAETANRLGAHHLTQDTQVMDPVTDTAVLRAVPDPRVDPDWPAEDTTPAPQARA